jgi:glyoxylase-like metal-dependent hydrolase (beta-lactamase superfamily II)
MNRWLVALFVALVPPAVAQQDFSKVEIKTTRLTNTIYMLEGAGGNIGVSAGEDSVFVVDDQFAPLTGRITAAIAKITPKAVQFILNTHWHFDHTGGNENFGKAGVVIVAHENVRRRMNSDQMIEFLKMDQPKSPKAALPVITFPTSMSFHLNGEEIRIVHVARAHTDGDSIVFFTGSDVVHMGDIFFNGLYPFIDTSSGGAVAGVIAACDLVLGMVTDKTRIIPGHGPLATREDLRGYREMLATVSGRIRNAIAEGRSDADIAKAGFTRDFDDKWGKGFMKPDRFVVMLIAGMRKAN